MKQHKKTNYKSTRLPSPKQAPTMPVAAEGMKLNKFVASCGICSRRQAVDLIKSGKIKVNNTVVLEPWYEVKAADKITYEGKILIPEIKQVYILMNKPKNYLTTLKDDRGRKTVMELLEGKVKERIFPVGRLDRATMGLLLLTNDGELAQKLAHPSYRVKKIYQVKLDKPISAEDLQKIRKGLILEDGVAEVDGVDYLQDSDGTEVGIEIHIGRNRIVRRIFEHLGYEVIKLDRTYYAGLTKKNLPRGWFRQLTPEEVRMLKHFT
jgi:23S rRNA pseudouridine2605 synthase